MVLEINLMLKWFFQHISDKTMYLTYLTVTFILNNRPTVKSSGLANCFTQIQENNLMLANLLRETYSTFFIVFQQFSIQPGLDLTWVMKQKS